MTKRDIFVYHPLLKTNLALTYLPSIGLLFMRISTVERVQDDRYILCIPLASLAVNTLSPLPSSFDEAE